MIIAAGAVRSRQSNLLSTSSDRSHQCHLEKIVCDQCQMIPSMSAVINDSYLIGRQLQQTPLRSALMNNNYLTGRQTQYCHVSNTIF